jgi:hypothetical protein
VVKAPSAVQAPSVTQPYEHIWVNSSEATKVPGRPDNRPAWLIKRAASADLAVQGPSPIQKPIKGACRDGNNSDDKAINRSDRHSLSTRDSRGQKYENKKPDLPPRGRHIN